MKHEVSKEEKQTLSQVMEKYGGVFSINIASGFAHLKYLAGEMYVTWLNDEGYEVDEGHEVPFRDIERVADFMREMKQLRLAEYEKPARKSV